MAGVSVGRWTERPWGEPWFGQRKVLASAARVTEIGLARAMCYGPCPVYSVRLQRNGLATFHGEHFVHMLDEHVARLDPMDFEYLALAMVYLRFGSLRRHYTVDRSDAPSETVWMTRNGRRRTVEDYGDAAPPPLHQIMGLIDDAASLLDWQAIDGDMSGQLTGEDGLPIPEDHEQLVEEDEPVHWTQQARLKR